MKILLTGGAGFLGQNLAKACADYGHEVHIIDLKPSKFSLYPLERFCRRIAYDVDITSPPTLVGHFDGMDAVFHLAGLVSFWRKAKDALLTVNVDGTRNVVDASIQASVSRLIHVSSVAAIGYENNKNSIIDEGFRFDWSTVRHKHYMLSKHLAEKEVLQACARGLRATIVNPGLMWGPGDMLNSSKLILGMKKGGIPACPPGGTNIVDVRDVAAGLVPFTEKGAPGERYILGGYNISFREVYAIVAAAVGVAPPRMMLPYFAKPLIYALAWVNESVRSVAPPLTSDNVDSSFMFRYFSSDKAKKEMGWKTSLSFEQTIHDSAAWLRANAYLE